MNLTFLSSLISFCLLSISLFGQEPTAINYTIENGLLSNEVYDLFEDENGYIWMGTDKGANRFNSYTIQSFTKNEGLADNDVLSIDQDNSGLVWFLSYNGELSYFRKGKLYSAEEDIRLRDIKSKSYFASFLEDEMGQLWFGTQSDGIFKIHPRGLVNHILQKDVPKKKLGLGVNYLFEDLNGIVHFSNANGIFRFEEEKLYALHLFPTLNTRARFHFEKKENHLFYSSENEVSLFSIEHRETYWTKRISNVKEINAVEVLSDSLLYVATDNGVYSFNKKGKRISSYLKGKQVSDILIDREGNLWASTLYNGVFFIRNKEIVSYRTSAKFAIARKGDSILFGGAECKLHYIINDELFSYPIKTFLSEQISSQDKITTLIARQHDQIWFGTNRALFQLEGSVPNLLLYHKMSDALFHDEYLYAGSSSGFLLKLDSNAIETLFHLYKNDQNSTKENAKTKGVEKYNVAFEEVHCFSNVQGDYFFIGTEEGILSYSNSILQLRTDLPRGKVVDIKVTGLNDLWILLEKEGLYFYNYSEKNLRRVELLPQVKNIFYSSLELEEDSIVWISSNKGVFYVEKEEDYFRFDFINESRGLASEEVNALTVVSDKIWLASSKGITSMPKKLFVETVSPLLYIDSIHADGRTAIRGSLNDFTSDKNTLSIYLTGISFKDQGQLTYHYELDGEEHRSGSFDDHSLVLNDLKPSNYEFMIYVVDSMGNRSSLKKIYFKINFIWWRSRWFWLLFVLVVVSLSAITIRLLYRKNLKKVYQMIKGQTALLKKGKRSIRVKSATTGGIVKIFLEDLYYIKGARDYVELFQKDKTTLVRATMNSLMDELEDAEGFIRIHRSYIVNLKKVEESNFNSLKILNENIPVARGKRDLLKQYTSTI